MLTHCMHACAVYTTLSHLDLILVLQVCSYPIHRMQLPHVSMYHTTVHGLMHVPRLIYKFRVSHVYCSIHNQNHSVSLNMHSEIYSGKKCRNYNIIIIFLAAGLCSNRYHRNHSRQWKYSICWILFARFRCFSLPRNS